MKNILLLMNLCALIYACDSSAPSAINVDSSISLAQSDMKTTILLDMNQPSDMSDRSDINIQNHIDMNANPMVDMEIQTPIDMAQDLGHIDGDMMIKDQYIPQMPHFGLWSQWSECANGQQVRQRECLNPQDEPINCEQCGGPACMEQRECTACDLIGVNVAYGGNCMNSNSAECMDNYQACSAILQDHAARCFDSGCLWVGPTECSVGGSVSNATVYGGKGDCLSTTSPQYHYADWSNWSACANNEQQRTRACLDAQNQVADCQFCGGVCEERQACQSLSCELYGVNVVNCNPNVPGDLNACNDVLYSSKQRCESNGCVWTGPLQCTIGGSVSNGNCYGGTSSCANP